MSKTITKTNQNEQVSQKKIAKELKALAAEKKNPALLKTFKEMQNKGRLVTL